MDEVSFAFDAPTHKEICTSAMEGHEYHYEVDRHNIFDAWFTYRHILHERTGGASSSSIQSERRCSKTKKSKKTFKVGSI